MTQVAWASAAVLGGMLAHPATVAAATSTWTNNPPVGGPYYWSNANNWVGKSKPVNGSLLEFGSTKSFALLSVNDITNLSIAQLDFLAGAGAYSLSGNSFISTGNITNFSSNLQTFSSPLFVGANQTWGAFSGGLAFNGINFATFAGSGYTISGIGSNTSLGDIVNYSNYRQSFSAPLTVGASQTWSGGTAGLSFNGFNFASTAGASYTVSGYGNLYNSGNITNSSSHLQTFSAPLTLSSTQTWTGGTGGLAVAGINGNGVLNLGATGLWLGPKSGSVTASYSGNINATTGGLNFSSTGGTQTLSGNNSIGSLTVWTGNLVQDGGSQSVGSSINVNGGTLLIKNGALVTALANTTNMDIYGDSANVIVSGTGTQLHLGSSGLVEAQGTLTVEKGATVNVDLYLYLGTSLGSNGFVNVDGTGSKFTTQFLIVGFNQGVGALTISNGGTVTSTANTWIQSASSSIAINGGALVTGSLSGSSGSISLTDPDGGTALTFNGASNAQTFSGGISGSGSVLKTGGSTQVLSGANTFTGNVTVTGGLLEMSNGAAGYYQASSGGKLKLDFGNLGFSTVQSDAGGTVTYNTNALTGGTLGGAGTHDVSTVTRFYGTTFANGASMTLANNVSLYGVNSAGNLTVASGNTATWRNGANAGGTLTVNGTANVQGWTSSGVTQVNAGGTLNNLSGGNLTLLGGSRTYVGSKAAPGGTINLASGNTIELNGALLVNNGTVAGTTNVNYGSLAKGSGTYGAVNVMDGGTFEAGNSPGTVTTGSTTWNGGGSYLVAMDKASGVAGVNTGLWNINGALSILAGPSNGGLFTIDLKTLSQSDQPILLSDFDARQTYHWQIASASGGITGFAADEFTINSSGFMNLPSSDRFTVTESGNAIYLNYIAAVPEPETWALMLAGLMVVPSAARRRRKALAEYD